MKKKWEEHQDDDEFLKDLLFESNLSLTQIAAELSLSVANLNKRIKQRMKTVRLIVLCNKECHIFNECGILVLKNIFYKV